MPQQQPIADALERVSADLDTIIQELRLGRRDVAQHHDVEERVQQLARDMIAPFRGEAAAGRIVRGRSGGVWACP